MRRFVFPLLMTVMWCAATALGLELYVRLVIDDGMQYDLEMWKYAVDVKVVSVDPLIGHRHGANRHATLMGVTVATNSRGLRDREFEVARTEGVLRIVMLGDSLTEGWGVPVEDTFAKRVERRYAEHGVTAEAINTGVGNWNTVQEVELFFTDAYRYNPDIVVLNFAVNDAEPVPHDRPPSWLMRHCFSCVYVAGRFDELMRRFSEAPDWASYYLGLFGDGNTPGWLDAKAAIKKLADYCKERQIKLVIASIPELHDVKNYPLQRITDLVRAAANENGVAFVDVLPYLQGEESSSLWVTPPDPHPNSLAHKLIAAALFDTLRQLP